MTMRSTSLSAFIAIVALMASGCCVDRFGGRHGDCHDGGCGVKESCAECDDVGCGTCRGPGPIQALKGMIHGGGCGEFYLDEWISNPPYCCDPCDDHGGWVGPRCCPPKIPGLKALFGQRGVGCTCGACLQRPPFAHHGEFIDGEMIEGEVIYDGPVINESVEPAETIRPTTLRPTPARPISNSKPIKKGQIRSHKVYYERAAAGH